MRSDFSDDLVYQPDATYHPRSSIYHRATGNGMAACQPDRIILADCNYDSPDRVDERLRCKKKACRSMWENRP